MRLLQKSSSRLLLYSLLLVVLSIPVSWLSINHIIQNDMDEMLLLYRDDFMTHVKQYEYLDDLETDLLVVDNVVYDIDIKGTDNSPFRDVFKTIRVFDSLQNETYPFRTLTSKVIIKHKPYLLTVRVSLINNDDLVLTLGVAQIILATLLALGFVFISRFLSEKLWRPFYKTLNRLKVYELDKHREIIFDRTDITEFNDLNRTLKQLTERNRKVFLQQKEFIENLSHEMQTPLAILHSKVDMLMQYPDLNEEQSMLIQDLASSLQRLTRLNKNMLLLSKIENEQFSDQETFDITASISTLVANMKPMADIQNITIHYNARAERITANKTMVEVLVSNLLTNAIRYNQPDGVIMIENENRKLIIRNTGKPLEFPIEKLFERFIKGTGHQGTGLGLSIVKKICDGCNYTLAYSYENNMHQFSVAF